MIKKVNCFQRILLIRLELHHNFLPVLKSSNLPGEHFNSLDLEFYARHGTGTAYFDGDKGTVFLHGTREES